MVKQDCDVIRGHSEFLDVNIECISKLAQRGALGVFFRIGTLDHALGNSNGVGLEMV